MLKTKIVCGCLVGALVASACDKRKSEPAVKKEPPSTQYGLTAEQAQQPLVVVGDERVTVGEFAEQIAEKSPYLRARYSSPERRRELLDELVKFELLAYEASRRGLDKAEEVERAKKQVMVQQLMKAEFEDKVKLSDVSDQEIEAYYKAHPEEFNKPAQRRASHIVVKDRAKAKQLLAQVLHKKDDSSLFRALAASASEDEATKTRGGDLQFFSRVEDRAPGDPEVPAPVVEAAFALEQIGDVSPELVQSEQGFHIVKLTGMRKPLERTLDQARRTIQNKLWREKREAAIQAFVTSLRDQAKIETHWELLDQVAIGAAQAPAEPKKPNRGSARRSPSTSRK